VIMENFETAKPSHGVKIWKDIRQLRETFAENIGSVVEGRKIHFGLMYGWVILRRRPTSWAIKVL